MNFKRKFCSPENSTLSPLFTFHLRGTETKRPPGGLRGQIKLLS